MKLNNMLQEGRLQTMSSKFVGKFEKYIKGVSDKQLAELADLWAEKKSKRERRTVPGATSRRSQG